MQRFSRIEKLLGEEGLYRLQRAHVTVVGLGAVGGHVAEALARAGVGHLRLVDFDMIQPTNINRQILALESTVGRAKAAVAEERVLGINPDCRVEGLQLFVAEESLDQLFDPIPDLVIDAIDSLNPKVQLLVGAHARGIPVMSSMGAALRTDPTKVAFGDLFDSSQCPLAKRMRKRLRQQGVGRGISCVYSTEQIDYLYPEAEREEMGPGKNPYADRGRPRRVLGSLPTITAIFGLILANQAILRLSSASPLDLQAQG
jgi:tRNA threonylcarbamoyladenosine dehydratase